MAEYTLAVSEAEVMRYRMMAQEALVHEAQQLALAGISAGATVADVGSGPAAMSVELARLVAPSGRVIAIEREAEARAAAQQLIAMAGADNVELREGTATDTGLPPASIDVAMMRHVLAHNGGDEQRIVDHLASLVRSGGAVYLVDVDLTAMRFADADPELYDINERYVEFHRRRGNDPQVGLRLGKLLTGAGLELVHYSGFYNIVSPPPGMRAPVWAARDAMVAAGVATQDDVDRWSAAFERMDTADPRPTIFAPVFLAIGRKS
jgi:predicted O-methyltransferase YrrM